MLFIDLKVAYSTIFRSKMLTMMDGLSVLEKLVRLVRRVLMEPSSRSDILTVTARKVRPK